MSMNVKLILFVQNIIKLKKRFILMSFTVEVMNMSRYRYRPVTVPLPSRYRPVTVPLPSRYRFEPYVTDRYRFRANVTQRDSS